MLLPLAVKRPRSCDMYLQTLASWSLVKLEKACHQVDAWFRQVNVQRLPLMVKDPGSCDLYLQMLVEHIRIGKDMSCSIGGR